MIKTTFGAVCGVGVLFTSRNSVSYGNFQTNSPVIRIDVVVVGTSQAVSRVHFINTAVLNGETLTNRGIVYCFESVLIVTLLTDVVLDLEGAIGDVGGAGGDIIGQLQIESWFASLTSSGAGVLLTVIDQGYADT